MQKLNILSKIYLYGEVLTSESLNLIVTYLNNAISSINELITHANNPVSHNEFRYKNSVYEPDSPTGDGLSGGWAKTPTTPNFSIDEGTWMSLSIVLGETYGNWSRPIRITGLKGGSGNSGSGGRNGSYMLYIYKNSTLSLVLVPTYSNSLIPTDEGWSTEATTPDFEHGEYTWATYRTISYKTNNLEDYGTWITPYRVSGENGLPGEDGKYLEFIYKRYNSQLTWVNSISNPATWNENSAKDTNDKSFGEADYTGPASEGWSDNPGGVDSDLEFEYMSQRTYNGQSFGPFSEPVIWSRWGLNGEDGDGYEYIYKGYSAQVTNWNLQGDWNPNSWTNKEGFQESEYYGPSGYLWNDNPIGVNNSENKYVYVAVRKRTLDETTNTSKWSAYKVPTLWARYAELGENGINAPYHLWAYQNNASNPGAPETSDDVYPPTNWTQTAETPNTGEFTWCIERLIKFDINNLPKYGGWCTPYRITGDRGLPGVDGDMIEFIYTRNGSGIAPNAPEGTNYPKDWPSHKVNGVTVDYDTDSNGVIWYDNPLGVENPAIPNSNSYEYISSREYNGATGEWGPYTTPRIWAKWGEKGDDGDGYEYIYTNEFSGDSPSAPPVNGNYPEDWPRHDLNGTSVGYDTDTNGTKWYDDPQGVSPEHPKEFVSTRKKQNGVWGSYSVPGLWALYVPAGVAGLNGLYTLFIYRNSDTNPETPTYPTDDKSGIPANWSSIATSPTSGQYTWCSTRIISYAAKTNLPLYGDWNTPYRITGEDGQPGTDGSFIEFIYTRSNSLTPPAAPPSNGTYPRDWSGTDGNGVVWTDNPQGVGDPSITGNYKYEYVSSREYNGSTQTWGNYSSPGLWSNFGEKGQDGDGYEYIYKRFISVPTWGNNDENPANWTVVLSEDYLGPDSPIDYRWSDEPEGVNSTYIYEYMSTRKRENGTWGLFSTPVLWAHWAAQGTNGGNYLFAYKNLSTQPTKPANGATLADAITAGWVINPSTPNFANGEYTWMTQVFVDGQGIYGEWSNAIRITGDNGRTGIDGTITEFIYTRNNTGIAPATPPTTLTDDWHGTLNAETEDEVTWTDNPQGVLNNLMYEYVSTRTKSSAGIWGAYSTPVIWSKWGEKGLDGDGYEYIYLRFDSELNWANISGNTNPSNWTNLEGFLNIGYLGPTGNTWTDDPQGVSSNTNERFEYVSQRKYNGTTKTWGSFSTPALWAQYVPPGSTGLNGSYNLYAYKISDLNLASGGAPTSTDGALPTGWSSTLNTSPGEGEHIWAIQRTVSYLTSNSTPNYGGWCIPYRITGDDGLPGTDGNYMEFIYLRLPEPPASWDNTLNGNNPYYWTDLSNVNTNSNKTFEEADYTGPGSSSWTDNPTGIDSINKYEYMSLRVYDGTTQSFGQFTLPVIWARWGEKGEDGDGTLYIYKHFEIELIWKTTADGGGNENPANWEAVQDTSASSINGEYYSNGWTDNPQGIDSTTYLYEYVSIRKKRNGEWSTYSTPKLWSSIGATGTSPLLYVLEASTTQASYGVNYTGNKIWTPGTVTLTLKTILGTTYNTLNSIPSGTSLYIKVMDGSTTSYWSNSVSLGTAYTLSDLTLTAIGDRIEFILYNSTTDAGNVLSRATVILKKDVLRMIIPAGEYTNKEYTRTDFVTPLVYYNGNYYFLNNDTNELTSGTYTAPPNSIWVLASEYDMILTKALFADFAKLGSFVIYGDYFFSLYGYKIDSSGTATYTTTVSDYQYFDSSDPMAETNPESGYYKFRPMKCTNAKTGEEWSAGGNIHSDENGNVTMSGSVYASLFRAGLPTGLNVTVEPDSINFNYQNSKKAWFTMKKLIESDGEIIEDINASNAGGFYLYMISPYNGKLITIDFTNLTFTTVSSSSTVYSEQILKIIPSSTAGVATISYDTIYYTVSQVNGSSVKTYYRDSALSLALSNGSVGANYYIQMNNNSSIDYCYGIVNNPAWVTLYSRSTPYELRVIGCYRSLYHLDGVLYGSGNSIFLDTTTSLTNPLICYAEDSSAHTLSNGDVYRNNKLLTDSSNSNYRIGSLVSVYTLEYSTSSSLSGNSGHSVTLFALNGSGGNLDSQILY